MDFKIKRQYIYSNDIHNSKIINYKTNNIATMNMFNNIINTLISREEINLNIQEIYFEIDITFSGNGGGIIANDANVRLLNCGLIELFSSVKLEETIKVKTIEYINHVHHNLYKLLTSTSDENESGFVGDQRERDS